MKTAKKTLFMRHVESVTETGCWIWTGALLKAGYGIFGGGASTQTAHRASWGFFRGEIPSDKQVLHRCDVKCCVNPDHLYLGTTKQNVRDALERGQKETGDRHWRRRNPERQLGEDAPHRTLTELAVREIRASSESQHALARKHGVSQAQISRIILRQSWKHI